MWVVWVLLVIGASPWLQLLRRPLTSPTPGQMERRNAVRTADRVDTVVVLELLDVACRAGVSIPRAFEAVGDALGGVEGRAFREVGAALLLGAPWSTAWAGVAGGPAQRVVARALEASWSSGAAPSPGLRAAGDSLRRDAVRRARTAAGRLGVRLVLPLGLCLLPAFILLGLVPIFVSLGSGLLGG